jgi:RNA polymerase sigma-70 factor (ECF subfamily)
VQSLAVADRVTDERSTTRSGAGPSDAALVVAARAGETWAQEAIFRRYVRMLNGLAYRILGRDDEVDDLVQESFAQALGSLDRLKEPAALSSWLGAIVVRTAGKILRRRRLRIRLGLERAAPIDVDSLIGANAPPDVKSELRAVYSALAELPPEVRVALVLRRIEGMKLEQIAETMSLSLATVKRRLEAAERALARFDGGKP